MPVAVEFAGVEKHFGEKVALAGIDLRLHRGEMVALLGPNGAGKSTAVSLMLGLRAPTAGTARVLGGPAGAAVTAGRVGAMLQTGGLPPNLRVSELVDFVRRLYPRPRTLDDVLQMAGCRDFAAQMVDRLSGGQAQRVRFAMAIAGDPELLFLDEPTTGFDVDTRRRFWAAIRDFAGGGRTVLFATHYLEEADAIADRIVVIQRGRIVADGTTAAIKANAGGSSIRFDWPGAHQALLAGMAGVSRVEVTGDRVRLHTTDADATVRALCAAEVPFRGLEIGGGDLEEAFLALVGEGAGNEEEAAS